MNPEPQYTQFVTEAINACLKAQPDPWHMGASVVTAHIATLMQSEDKAARAFGAMLLGHLAFARYEGAIQGSAGTLLNLEQALREDYDACPDVVQQDRTKHLELLTFIRESTVAKSAELYDASYASYVQHYAQETPVPGAEAAAMIATMDAFMSACINAMFMRLGQKQDGTPQHDA